MLDYLVDPEGFYRGVGVAPSARIIVGKLNEDRADSPNATSGATHVHFKELVASAGKQGARFANNSWNLTSGYSDPVYVDEYGYTSFSKIADFLVRHGDGWGGGHQHEMAIVFAAGNWDGTGNDSFVASPANAKNVITVGATRGWAHDPDSAMAGSDEDDCFFESSEPYTISDVAGFSFKNFPGWHSRRGVENEVGSSTQMPRIKPDLVAPGSHLSAAYSQFALNAALYRCFGGTSAAAPFVTGAAVLAEAWYFHRIGDPPKKPSPAMIKAMLIAHADDLEGATDWIDESNVGHRPALSQGWGRVNLGKLFQEDTAVEVFDQDARDYSPFPNGRPDDARRFTVTGQSWSERFVVDVDGPTDVVTIVMVYTDRFAWQGADPLTVNDLDLKVFKYGLTPAQTRAYWGNYFDSDGFSKRVYKSTSGGPSTDTINTVEMVRLRGADLAGGQFGIQVRATNVNQQAVPGLDGTNPNQDFALYVWNATLVNGQ